MGAAAVFLYRYIHEGQLEGPPTVRTAQGIKDDFVRYPNYAQLFTWASSTPDLRALQKASNLSDQIAATWYSPTSFAVDVNLNDGQTHQIALYAVDWDNSPRIQRVDVLDAANQNVLDSRHSLKFQTSLSADTASAAS